MKAQSTVPEIGRSSRQDRSGDTSEIPGGLEPGGRRPVGRLKSSNLRDGEIEGPTVLSPTEMGQLHKTIEAKEIDNWAATACDLRCYKKATVKAGF